MTKTFRNSVNHTRFPKEDYLPDWASAQTKLKKGDRVKKETSKNL